MNDKKMSNLKPIVSINEICRMLQLSRSRYYQLIESGFLPKPFIDVRSKRPYYDQELQQKCLDIRESGIGANKAILLFYSPRKKDESKASKKRKLKDSASQEFAETLNSMGLDCSEKEAAAALTELYPNGTKDVETGLIIRELYRHLKSK